MHEQQVLAAVVMPVAIERGVELAGAAAISGEASDSQGEVGSKQLGASAANQTRGAFPYQCSICISMAYAG